MNIEQLTKESYELAVKRGEYDCLKCKGLKYDCSDCEFKNTDCDFCQHQELEPCPKCNGTGINPDKNINELTALILPYQY